MKQKKLLSLGITLLLGLSQLFAQKQNPTSLKSGDWFETDIQISNSKNTSNHRFDVRYDLSNKSQNGDLIFKVSIERMRLKYADANNTWFGYDSYYPPYVENRKRNPAKQVYQATANSQGKISNIKLLSNAPKPSFFIIDVKEAAYKPKSDGTVEHYLQTENLKQISETIVNALVTSKNVIKTIDLTNVSEKLTANAVLKSASFKLLRNAVIKGKIINLTKADSIYSITSASFSNQDDIFRFYKDGSFSAEVVADRNSRRRFVFGQFDEFKTFSLLLEPLDTLVVKADANDFDNTVSFAGNAAAKASLSKELVAVFDRNWVNESNYRTKSIEEFIAEQDQGKKDFEAIISKYTNRISAEILSYCRSEFRYIQAGTKLQYVAEYRKKNNAKGYMDDFPKDFFLEIDTLPVSMSSSEGGMYYGYYLGWLQTFQQTKLGKLNANKYGFFADYATAMGSFDGYHLYFSIYESLLKEMHRNEVESTQRLKNYYEDFIHNCGNTWFINRVKEQWSKTTEWMPGNPIPIKKFLLKDGSNLELAKFKGKPLVLIVNNNQPEVLKGYYELIKKQKSNEVHFVIAQWNTANWGIDEKLKALPNVTYIELSNDDKQTNLSLYYLQTKVFAFTSELKVISSLLIDQSPGSDSEEREPQAHENELAEQVKNAIDSNLMSKEQKASLMNIIGWSIGSALLASLIVFYIYRSRIASAKKKAQLENKIKNLEIKAIRSQMNPHFMFNALNSIQSLINNAQYNEANVYLEKFALLMRSVLNNSEQTFIPLSDELEAIKLYCELEQLRFNFKFKLKVANEVNTQLMEIPGMIIQPLVENSILHGLAQKGDLGYMEIAISCEEKCLKIVVKDNGAGLKEKTVKNDKSFGLKLVRERLDLLSTGENIGDLHLISNLNENGVTAVLTIPID
ncbi:MAG: hypothetical protein EOO42_03785 [Flavobacteriales bacterium]|nr:MAG: hypothetical protein EOO42_03785 [Flavobacteriales bacterium]